MKILIVLTSHGQLGDTAKKTGFWLEEFTTPYYVFKDSDAEITLASPAGGQPPLDPSSNTPEFQTDSTTQFKTDQVTQNALANTLKLEDIRADDYDAVFYPGGHGPLWDLAEDANSIKVIEEMYVAGKPISAVCHGPCVFRHAKNSKGLPIIQGRNVTSFTNTEEAVIQLTEVVPFLVEDMLRNHGGVFSRGDDFSEHFVVDGNIITGQNPASAAAVARALLNQLN